MVLAPDITKKPPNKLTTKYNEISTEYNEDSIEYNGFSTEYNGINTEYNGDSSNTGVRQIPPDPQSIIFVF